MKTANFIVCSAAVAIGLVGITAAQVQVLPEAPQSTDPGVWADEAVFPIPPDAYPATQRLAPGTIPDVVELPPARPPAPGADSYNAGYVDELPPDLVPPPVWSNTPDGGRVWAVEFRSLDAVPLRLRLRGRFGLDGLELRVYDPKGAWTHGPYQGLYVDENGHWWTTIIFGDSIGLEFHAPPGMEAEPSVPEFDGYACYNLPPPESESPQLGCDLEDVMCHGEWLSTAEGVCMLAVVNGNVVGYSSGGLLGRNPSDGSPFIMTANHCDPMSRATVFVWNYRSTRCNGPDPGPPNSNPRNEGAHLMRSASTADWKLLALRERPKAGRFLGWASGFWDSFADGTGIHHPRGMNQSISWGYNEGMAYGEFCPQIGPCFWAHTWGVRLTTGTTFPGSSGSPVFDSSRRVRGTLSGGYNCDVDYYGRLQHAWDRMKSFLHNPASPMYVDTNYGGEEMHGTSEEPFPRLVQGVYAVRAGDRVIIRAGSYPDRMTIFRPMTLTASGGVVRIGN
ncbi:MAG: hypothetical protein C4547_15355 [Phycisphaerales bacterium]|nr:MAG: hypothetical protein C4547_15355 [Phycisphaerales bacterium]